MIVETLFPEYGNLYGDPGNMRYLRRCLPQAQFADTPMYAKPVFAEEDVALIYMGPMTESAQEKAVAHLKPYTERLRELMEKGTVFLLTGNAMEVLGEGIENEDGSRIEGLGLLPVTAKRDMMRRYADVFKGRFEDMEIVGFKTQFTKAWPAQDSAYPFITVEKGEGLHKGLPYEGIHMHNMFGTYLLGPLLIMNPPFTRYLLRLLGAEPETLPFEEEIMEAYRRRLRDYEK